VWARISAFRGLSVSFMPLAVDGDLTSSLFGDVQRKREAVQAVYELKPMPDAERIPGTEGNNWGLGS
jgi:hypothetical protein